MAEKKILVACRIRPRMNNNNERYEIECCKKGDENTVVITQPTEENEKARPYYFSVDHVFDESDTQHDIYSECALDMVDACLEGSNATILAYGQTGSGKTFTVLGDVETKGETVVKPGSGLFLRCLTDLFNYKDRSRRTLDVTINLSIMEIYVDEVRDLLAKKAKLNIREMEEDVQIPNLTIVEVDSLSSVYKYYKIANAERSVTATMMNDVSSRSHAVFVVDLLQVPRDNPDANPLENPTPQQSHKGGKGKSSRLVLVDLAGSERVKKSGVEGKAMTEATAINKSLSALGNVVNGLYMESKHIPYRDSKLTRLLRSSFVDPNARILLITNLSPTGSSFNESLSSLRFADRVKGLKAAVVSTIDPVVEQEFLSTLRTCEELSTEIRIAIAGVDYKPQRIRKKYPRGTKDYLRQCVSEYQLKLQNEERLKKEREAQELQDMIKRETMEVISAWKKRNEDMKQQLKQATIECENMQKEVETCIADKEKEIEDKMNDAKKKKKDRRNAEERIEKTKIELDESIIEEKSLVEDIKKKEMEFADASGHDQENWDKEDELWKLRDSKNRIAEVFVKKLLIYRNSQLQLLEAKLSNQPMVNSVNAVKYEVSYSEIADLVDDIFDVMLTSVVERSTKSVQLLKKPDTINTTTIIKDKDKDESDEETEDKDRMDYDPGMRPMRQVNTHVQSNRAQVAFHNGVTTPYDEEEADRQYLMGIYDADNLIHDILKYLQSGTILLKHGRNGKPHFRKFWLEEHKELCWVDPENLKSKRSIVELKDVTGIILGQYTKVFRRNHSDMTEPEFYLSFTLLVKNGARTVDVVAETHSEFEAWLMGLSHVLNMEPRWGKPLDISCEEGFNSLSKEEQDVCSKNHITPQLYLKLQEVVNERREEVKSSIKLFEGDMEKVYQAVGGIHPPRIDKNGSLLMTKGELRYLANVDIFRTCAIWKMFHGKKLIYDPGYKPPTPVSTL
eukprot:NODE_219_length_3208_cov_30.579254_g190_i0.p1 GENE.NODE_219_length_3208_cov_30.579254_g190_i0~~NODE_219_length_3208_cov_30.579254_g190_i0.p1  ORF type:complete len:962 (+),score=220.10 NODE_219_length_3208_cov_30.579254_g190_i0:104-2989(+)